MNKFIIAEDVLKIIGNIIIAAKHPEISHGNVQNALRLIRNLERVKDDAVEKGEK